MSENVPEKVTDTGVEVPHRSPTTLIGSPRGSTEVTSTLNEAAAVTPRVAKFTVPVTGPVGASRNVARASPMPATVTVVVAGGSTRFPSIVAAPMSTEPVKLPGGTVTVWCSVAKVVDARTVSLTGIVGDAVADVAGRMASVVGSAARATPSAAVRMVLYMAVPRLIVDVDGCFVDAQLGQSEARRSADRRFEYRCPLYCPPNRRSDRRRNSSSLSDRRRSALGCRRVPPRRSGVPTVGSWACTGHPRAR